jgi:hypothetical protein
LIENQTVVYDIVGDYGEPGYRLGSGKDGIILGDYNGNYGDRESANGTFVDTHPRFMTQLAEQYELEWHDEWTIDYDNDKAYRTQADSYSWQSSILWTESGDMLTPDDSLETWVDELKNNPKKILTHFGPTELRAIGFERWPADDEYFESGWHPGQTDDPTTVTEHVRHELGDTVDILFYLDHAQQFDIRWTAYVRPVDNETADES